MHIKTTMRYHFTFPRAVKEGTLLSTSSPDLLFVDFFVDDHSNWCDHYGKWLWSFLKKLKIEYHLIQQFSVQSPSHV